MIISINVKEEFDKNPTSVPDLKRPSHKTKNKTEFLNLMKGVY
jgi:hypothetical protein